MGKILELLFSSLQLKHKKGHRMPEKTVKKKANGKKQEIKAGPLKSKDALEALGVLGRSLGLIDATHVHELIAQELDAPLVAKLVLPHLPPRDVLEIHQNKSKTIELKGVQHYKFPLLVKILAAKVHVLLVGPPGTGKSTAAMLAAKALGRGFEAISVGPQTSKADLLGYKDANGNYHSTAFTRAAKEGKILNLDELDAGHPGVLTIMNAALANGVLSTPEGTFEVHRDFVVIACANTWGTGANRIMVGRNQLDGATLDRFANLYWPVDEALEAVLSGQKATPQKLDISEGGTCPKEEWLSFIRQIREVLDNQGIRHIVSPRATLNGRALFDQGIGRALVEELVIWKGLDQDTRIQVLNNLK